MSQARNTVTERSKIARALAVAFILLGVASISLLVIIFILPGHTKDPHLSLNQGQTGRLPSAPKQRFYDSFHTIADSEVSSIPGGLESNQDVVDAVDQFMARGQLQEAADALLKASYKLEQNPSLIDANFEMKRFEFLNEKVQLHPDLLNVNYKLAYEMFTIAAREGRDLTPYLKALESKHKDQVMEAKVCLDLYSNYHSSNVRQYVESCAKEKGSAPIYDFLMNLYLDGKVALYEAEYEYFKDKYRLRQMRDFTEELEYLVKN